MILLESKSYILIHHTFTHSTCTRYYWEVWVWTLLLTSGFYKNLPHIFISYDIVMTRYMHTMLGLFVLNDYLSFYKVIFIILLTSKNIPVAKWFRNHDRTGVRVCMYRVLTDCATTALSRSRYSLFLYEHINLFWHWINN